MKEKLSSTKKCHEWGASGQNKNDFGPDFTEDLLIHVDLKIDFEKSDLKEDSTSILDIFSKSSIFDLNYSGKNSTKRS